MSSIPTTPPLDPNVPTATPKRPWYKKKRFLIPLILLAIIIIAAAASGGGGDEDPTGAAPAATQEEEAPAAEEESPAEEAPAEEETPAEEAPAGPTFPGALEDDVIGNAGDALVLDDINVTATPLVATTDVLGAYVCTTVTLNNTRDEAVDFSAGLDWELQDPTGTIRNSTFGGTENGLPAGSIAPGGTATGDVCFDGELAPGQFVLFYQPYALFESGRAAWISTIA